MILAWAFRASLYTIWEARYIIIAACLIIILLYFGRDR